MLKNWLICSFYPTKIPPSSPHPISCLHPCLIWQKKIECVNKSFRVRRVSLNRRLQCDANFLAKYNPNMQQREQQRKLLELHAKVSGLKGPRMEKTRSYYTNIIWSNAPPCVIGVLGTIHKV